MTVEMLKHANIGVMVSSGCSVQLTATFCQKGVAALTGMFCQKICQNICFMSRWGSLEVK